MLKSKKSLFSFPCLINDTPWASLLSTPGGYSPVITASSKFPGFGRRMGTMHLKQHTCLVSNPRSIESDSLRVGPRPRVCF